MKIVLSDKKDLKIEDIVELYKANSWSSADKPNELYNALQKRIQLARNYF